MAESTDNIPYTIRPLPEGLSRALFKVPSHLAEFLVSSPVTCRGASFDLHILCGENSADPHDKNESTDMTSIYTDFHSPKPSQTADAIAIRLAARLRDPNLPSASDTCIIT
mmetsp:Transcript_17280/g.23801  ORF Transcript_17280/g.23801 Transcript_17280/m.23801 type:complete len:111 (-) Transcript_17280:766-1098(-)|eukprot:CAMPEP_0185732526 /NCGR_PEP_ID=MMETSP1171-20130828/16530_1 /TAXON_ID=374046 /ORGANISM="Helicotheca tamensis, Strain CCMP826" /LENGTH=110 /DNA_ID=CAMNT_0028402033 /DNA_START=130 /DNA_END=462 /DNA_ORIENTATION=-